MKTFVMRLRLGVKLSPLLYLLSLLYLASCQSNPLPNEDRAIQEPFAWIVSKGDQSHLFIGTIHAGVHVADLPNALSGAISKKKVFVSELGDTLLLNSTRMREAVQHATESALLRERSQPHSKTIVPAQVLSAHEQSVFVQLVGPGSQQILKNGPLWLACLAAMQAALSDKGLGEGPSLDAELTLAAHSSGLRIHALETLDDQFSVFTDADFCPPESLQELLRVDAPKNDFDRLVETYRQGDLEQITLLLNDFSLESPALQEALLKRRNGKWLLQLEMLLPQDDTVVAVGLAHLIGPNGLLIALQQGGYRISRWPHKP